MVQVVPKTAGLLQQVYSSYRNKKYILMLPIEIENSNIHKYVYMYLRLWCDNKFFKFRYLNVISSLGLSGFMVKHIQNREKSTINVLLMISYNANNEYASDFMKFYIQFKSLIEIY